MITIEHEDIQGMIVKGYGRMHYSRYVMLKITDASLAKSWIEILVPRITNATHFISTTCLNIAFTSKGLLALGLSTENLDNFRIEFREDIFTPHRQRILGDYETSAPKNWNWGGPANDEIHIMLLLFSATKALRDNYYLELSKQFSAFGLAEIGALDGRTLPENKEHFGFRDGIGQPIIKGSGRTGDEFNTIAAGEFILGYKNEYDVFPDSPVASSEQGNINLLPPDCRGSGYKDIGRNGSYMVLRQMEQDVDRFWNFMNNKTQNDDGSINHEASTRLASKMIGRWPGGAPMIKFPDKDPGISSDDNGFEYADDDNGLKCPFGSHVRRINPRDTFENNRPKESLKITKHHRIMRRGRLYGEPFEGSPKHHSPKDEVGLLFLCFNADIGNQFEFLSYTWGNYPGVKELYNDPDPIIGVRDTPAPHVEQNFTIQDYPANKCVQGLQRFINIKGGAYFFFPSITAVRWIASIREQAVPGGK